MALSKEERRKARKKDFYKNVQDADEQKHLKALEEEKNRAAISGSALDALNPLRDENGFLLSYEDPKRPGETLTEELCKRGKNYIAARKRAGEKSSAYLSGRAVKV